MILRSKTFSAKMATLLNTTTSKGAGNYIGETKKQLRDGELVKMYIFSNFVIFSTMIVLNDFFTLNKFVFAVFLGFGVYNYSNKFFRYEGEWSKGKKHGNMIFHCKSILFTL